MRRAYRLRWVSDAALIERAEELLAAQGEQRRRASARGLRAVRRAHASRAGRGRPRALGRASILRSWTSAGVCGANVFALNEPDREPAYRAPNDRVLAWAAEAPDRLFPFVRLSLDEDPLRRGRALPRSRRARHQAAPARAGLPRSTIRSSRPSSRSPHERAPAGADPRGRGLPPGMPLELGHVAERHPDASLILAHAAIVAQAGIGELARSVENIFFDSSTWTPLDQLNLLSLVPPEQILWASDIPYGEPLAALNVFARAARVSGAGDDLLRGMLRRQRARPARGAPPRAAARRRSPRRSTAPRIARVRATMYMAGRHVATLDGHARSASDIWASPRPRCTRRASTIRPSSCAAPPRCWEQWAETLVPGAPPDLVGRGRVWRLLNAGPGRHGARVSEVTLALNGREWQRTRPRGRDARRGAARAGRPHGHEDRVRRGHLRRVHRARRRPRRALVHLARGAGRRLRGHDDRGSRRRGRALAAAACVRRGGRAAVRLLHGRAGRVGDRAPGREPASDERAGARSR